MSAKIKSLPDNELVALCAYYRGMLDAMRASEKYDNVNYDLNFRYRKNFEAILSACAREMIARELPVDEPYRFEFPDVKRALVIKRFDW